MAGNDASVATRLVRANVREESYGKANRLSIALVAAGRPLLAVRARSGIANVSVSDRPLTLTSPHSSLTPVLKRPAGGSLAIWVLVYGATVVGIYVAAGDLGDRIGAYYSGLATLVFFVIATLVALWPRIVKLLLSARNALRTALKPSTPHGDSLTPVVNEPSLVRPEKRLKAHMATAIAAMLPFWWHCQLRQASTLDQVLKGAAILLVTSGVLGVATLDALQRHRFIQDFLKYWSATHRLLALIAFSFIVIHVLAVLYFGGL